jgi:formylmethanofuran dehydrogenase subunit E
MEYELTQNLSGDSKLAYYLRDKFKTLNYTGGHNIFIRNGKTILSFENTYAENGEEISADTSMIPSKEELMADFDSYVSPKEQKETLKASAKAKLVAGEALTEEEANTIVL